MGFTGRHRERKTSRGIAITDFASRWIITLGGIGTIAAVLMVAVLLFWVVWPLFMPAHVGEREAAAVPWEEKTPIRVDTDEYQNIAWALFADGSLQMFKIATGELMATKRALPPEPALTAWSFSPGLGEAAFGFADGTARLGRIGFAVSFLAPADVDAAQRDLPPGSAVPYTHKGDPGTLERIAADQFRFVGLSITTRDPIETGSKSPVVSIDHSVAPSATRLVALHEDGSLFIEELRERTNILTGKTTTTVAKAQVPYEPPPGRARPDYLKLSGLGDNVLAIWKDGLLKRYDVRVLNQPRFAEEVRLVEEDGAVLTEVGFLLGKTTLLTGDSAGDVRRWFLVRPQQDPGTPDGATLVNPNVLYEGSGEAVTNLRASGRGRLFAVGFEDGSAKIIHATSRKLVADVDAFASGEGGGTPSITNLAISPKDDGLIAFTTDNLYRWRLDIGHPEVSLASMFRPVWYESATEPEHVWQSTGGTDDFEEKFGLYALIFGTIKATVYSLLFGVPIALAGAIYTSEFMHPRVKATVKPTIEMMASLPSVVLGFLAALVVAPFVENIVPATLASFFCVPLTLLLGAYLWQLLPQHVALRIAQWRFVFILLVIPLGVLLALAVGPLIERALFAGDIKLWLNARRDDPRFGNGAGGWVFILLPLCAVAVSLVLARLVNPYIRVATREWARPAAALVELAKFTAATVATLAVAIAVGLLLSVIGLDPRGGIVDTFVQRNALVVGFIMGFAIIPIIYTIAEDALSTVPAHLRSASLGAGATPWQTATRIIVPTAMSGLFSACMIGLGRAVGETMIVLMAAGNTPVLDWNMFSGFRTLSANIAVELPEAVRNSTHFRTLYLAALVLFLMTFVLNTGAEAIRQRFRRRAYQL